MTGINALRQIELQPGNQDRLEAATKHCHASPTVRARLKVEAQELLALSQVASRLTVLDLEIRDALRAFIELRAPVPCMVPPDDSLKVLPSATLGLQYPREALYQPLPGYAFVHVLFPGPVWHANVAPGPPQALCLGASIPAGVRVKDLVLMAYGALTMQTVMVDELDPAGVLHPEAARWWQLNLQRAPLSTEAFLEQPIQAPKRPKTSGIDKGEK